MPINLQGSSVKFMCSDHGIAKMYCENNVIYSSGNTVTYYIDSGVSYQEEVDEGASCLSPKSFTPAKSGWEFVGWRQDTAANGNVLSSLNMGDDPVTLYAVFKQTVTLSYNGNGTTSGSTAAQTGARYYNNGTVVNQSFMLRANGFTRTSYTFSKWALGSAGGTQYAAGASITISANTTMYAVWTAEPFTLTLNSSGWSGPTVIAGSFGSGPTLSNNYGGATITGRGSSSPAYAMARISKSIDTKGLSKADVYFPTFSNSGSVSIGNTNVEIYNNTVGMITMSIDPSKTTQTLAMELSSGGDTYNVKTITITKINFHN